MTMHTYLPRTNAFDPEAILTMSVAFELACADLQVFEAMSAAERSLRSASSTLRVRASCARPLCITAFWLTTPRASSRCCGPD